jgi:hypothetical protein
VLDTGSQVDSVIGKPFHSIRTSSSPSIVRRSWIRSTDNFCGVLRLVVVDDDGCGRGSWESDGDSAEGESL